MPTLNALEYTLNRWINDRDSAVADFQAGLKDPVHAFAWGDSTMRAVARGAVADHYKSSIQTWKGQKAAGSLTEDQPQNEDEVMAFIQKSVITQALRTGRSTSRSTSTCQNVMRAEEAAAYAELAADWDFLCG